MVSMQYCLTSVQIRDLVKQGIIQGPVDEKNIQTSSLEPTIDDHLYYLKSEGVLSPHHQESIRRQLLRLPHRHRSRLDIENTQPLMQGFSYLMPLQQQFVPQPDLWVVSSPKSTSGRLFNRVRFLADYQATKDEIEYVDEELLNLWILTEPQAFNQLVSTGQAFNQLRFFRTTEDQNHIREILEEIMDSRDLTHLAPDLYLHDADFEVAARLFDASKGFTARITGEDLTHLLHTRPILYDKTTKEPLAPNHHDGVQVHLDLKGESSKGVVGFELLKDPSLVELAAEESHDLLQFHEPILAPDGPLLLKAGHRYLLTIKEILNLPPYINVQVRPTSHKGLRADIHEAGYGDNRFIGDLVMEITPHEDIFVYDGMALSALDLFRTPLPDKVYGDKNSGSHYFNQIGPKPAKVFSFPDYEYIAKEYERLQRNVFTEDCKVLRGLMPNEGFEFLNTNDQRAIDEIVHNALIHSRYDCENDTDILQLIPYVILFGKNDTVLTYQRADSPHDVGDMRLAAKESIGFGGHITAQDGPDYITNNIKRQLRKEIHYKGGIRRPKFMGKLFTTQRDVDAVHFGLVHAAKLAGSITGSDKGILNPRFEPIDGLMQSYGDRNFESWSQILIPMLPAIKALYENN